MKTLEQAIESYGGVQTKALNKYLLASHIHGWEDCTKTNLNEFKDVVSASVCASSAKTYMASLRAILARFDDEAPICREYRDILKGKAERPVKTYLDESELKAFEAVPTHTMNETMVKTQCLLEAYTGCRISDVMELTEENILDDSLTYTSKKTSVTATLPLKPKVRQWISLAKNLNVDITLKQRNEIIRRLCERADIRTSVKCFRAGKTIIEPKFKVVSSHTFRISFCTNMARRGVPLLDISRMAGHTSTDMTLRYICNYNVTLSPTAMEYFK